MSLGSTSEVWKARGFANLDRNSLMRNVTSYNTRIFHKNLRFVNYVETVVATCESIGLEKLNKCIKAQSKFGALGHQYSS